MTAYKIRYLETDEEGLTNAEPYPVEQYIGGGRPPMPTDITALRKILALPIGTMPASCTFEPILPFEVGKILLAVEIRFEAIG